MITKSHYSKIRIALVYDNILRPDTTGEHVREALEQICLVDHFLPSHLDAIEPNYDLYLRVDDGLGIALPSHLKPSAWWVIDTHLQYEADLELAKNYDVVFAAQRDGAFLLKQDGIKQVHWLPLACNPRLHYPLQVSKSLDFAFVGNIFAGPRRKLLDRIRAEFPLHFVGNAYKIEMAKIYSSARLVFNRSIRNDINMRVFEAAACGSLLLTNDLIDNGLAELFTDQKHLITYMDEEDLVDKVRFYLKHEDLRERIGSAGAEQALRYHTYTHRVGKILEICLPQENLSKVSDTSEKYERPLISIIIMAHNQLEDTRRCIESLFRHTADYYELILIDNGSNDGTTEYFHKLQAENHTVKVIINPTNTGFAAGCNIGIRYAKGDFLLFLNNDTVVTPGWLDGIACCL
jgi:hypothetical protein